MIDATASIDESPSSAAEGTHHGGGLRFLLVSGAAAGSLAMLASVDPNDPGHYPTCPFLAFTGLYCPGCGALRAIHALTGGDVATAIERNPMVVLFVPLLIGAWLRWGLEIRGSSLARRFHPTRIPTWILWAGLTLILAFWGARNIPDWSWLSPA